MNNFIRVIFLILVLIPMFGCQSIEPSTHEILSKELQLPRNLEYGGFYCFDEYPHYVVIKDNQIEYFSGANLLPISVSELNPDRQIIVYIESSAKWTRLRDLMRALDSLNINTIYLAYNSDTDSGTSGGQTFRIQSNSNRKHGNIFDLILFNDGSVSDVISQTKYRTQDQLIREIGIDVDAILVSGHSETSAGTITKLLNSLAPISHINGQDRLFLKIK